jgi:hypothetical protein
VQTLGNYVTILDSELAYNAIVLNVQADARVTESRAGASNREKSSQAGDQHRPTHKQRAPVVEGKRAKMLSEFVRVPSDSTSQCGCLCAGLGRILRQILRLLKHMQV